MCLLFLAMPNVSYAQDRPSHDGLAKASDARQYNMMVHGLTCPFCVAASRRALKKIKGVYAVQADLEAGLISACTEKTTILTPAQMKKLFRKKGFTFKSMTQSSGCELSTPTSTADTGEATPRAKAAYGSGEAYGSGHDKGYGSGAAHTEHDENCQHDDVKTVPESP